MTILSSSRWAAEQWGRHLRRCPPFLELLPDLWALNDALRTCPPLPINVDPGSSSDSDDKFAIYNIFEFHNAVQWLKVSSVDKWVYFIDSQCLPQTFCGPPLELTSRFKRHLKTSLNGTSPRYDFDAREMRWILWEPLDEQIKICTGG